MKKIDVSIIIACFNEEQIFSESIEKIYSVMDATRWSYEIIFVDDLSQDRTRSLIKQLITDCPDRNISKIFHPKNTGRGKSVSDGILASHGKYVGYLDIDLEVSAHYIPLMIINLENNADIATAFRVYKATPRLMNRVILSIGYRMLMKIFLRTPLKDTESGFKFFNREKILTILSKTKDPGWFWDTEIMTLSHWAGLKIVELPCLFIRRYDKKSSVKLFKDSIKYFIKLIQFSRQRSLF